MGGVSIKKPGFFIPGAVQGDVLYFDGTTWVSLGAGVAGQQLTTQGAGADPTWGAGGLLIYARGTTYTVAASDSQDTVNADYFCDGVADEVQINAAITALPASGGIVYLMEGTYTLSSQINLASHLTLIGSGFGTHITAPGNFQAISGFAGNRVQVKNLWLSGEGSGDSLANNIAIELKGMKFVEIENILIGNPGFGQYGIKITDSGGVICHDISIRGILTDTTNGTGATEICYADLIYIAKANRISINNCVLKGAEDSAINFQTTSTASTDISIVGNVLGETQAQFACIRGTFNSANRVTICGNVIENTTYIGIDMKGTEWTVVGNVIQGTGGDEGIRIYLVHNSIIANNRILNFATGILSTGDNDDNVIEGNRISNCTTGINLVAGADDNIVTGNSIRGTVATPLIDGGANNIFFSNKEL